MAEPLSARAILKALDASSYYVILEVPKDVTPEVLQDAFHRFALEYHPDRYVRESRESAALAAEIFKRGAEAFAVLGDPAVRKLYDEGLARGHVRYIEGEAAKAKEAAKPRQKTLEEIATKPRAKELAMKADRLLVAGKIEDARILLIDAVQDDSENAELRARLNALYTMGGAEKLGGPGRAAAPAPSARPPAPSARPAAPSARPPSAPSGPPRPPTLEEIASTPKAKDLARRADRLLAVKKYEEARVLLTDAVQDDFENAELKARLYALYTAEGYEVL